MFVYGDGDGQCLREGDAVALVNGYAAADNDKDQQEHGVRQIRLDVSSLNNALFLCDADTIVSINRVVQFRRLAVVVKYESCDTQCVLNL